VTRNISVNKTVHKETKSQEQKQETGNKVHTEHCRWGFMHSWCSEYFTTEV